jgi:uncharacterized membrane protein
MNKENGRRSSFSRLRSSFEISRSVSWLPAAAVLLWTGALPLAAWLRSGPGGSAALFSFLIYGVGSVICHQRPERSFYIGSMPLAVCARCTGIYAGAAAAALAALVGCRFPSFTAAKARGWLAAAAAPAVLSLLYEWGTGRTPSNNIRAATGVLIGAAVAVTVFAVLRDEAGQASDPAVKR